MRAEFLFLFFDNLKGRGRRKPFLIFKSRMKRGAGALQKGGAAVFFHYFSTALNAFFQQFLGIKGERVVSKWGKT